MILYPFLFVGITFLFFYLYNALSRAHEDRLKAALHAREKEYYFTQCQLMQESVENVKSIKHDINAHLVTLKEFSIGSKAATDYLSSLIEDVRLDEIYSQTGNIAFDSVINYKLRTATQDNVELDISTFIPPLLNVEAVDVVTILGNLLDNALDAVSKVDNRKINLSIRYDKNSLLIHIDNSFDGIVEYADGADSAGSSILSRKAGDDHGHGLKNIRKSVEKYNGHVEITHDDHVFSVGILLYV